MRPPEFTGGNACTQVSTEPPSARFNEAAGIHRRKHSIMLMTGKNARMSFNEAAGIHRRKLVQDQSTLPVVQRASMRPPEFTGGNMFRSGRRSPSRNTLQ